MIVNTNFDWNTPTPNFTGQQGSVSSLGHSCSISYWAADSHLK